MAKPSKKSTASTPQNLAEMGSAVAQRSANKTIARIEEAMREIEKDIEANAGVYPFADGEISTAEVLRRAGLSSAALQKERHRANRELVAEWVTGVQRKVAIGAKVVRRAVTERARSAEDRTAEIRQRWVEAELEYVEVQAELRELKRKCTDLELENARLLEKLLPTNVISIARDKV